MCDNISNPDLVPPCNNYGDNFLVPSTCINAYYDPPQIGSTGECIISPDDPKLDPQGNTISRATCCGCSNGNGASADIVKCEDCNDERTFCGPGCIYDKSIPQVCKASNGGFQGVYKRVAFTADPLTCCLKNNACNQGVIESCYQDETKMKTCAPEHRDITSSSCATLLEPICTGASDNTTSWLANWTEGINGTSTTCSKYIDYLLTQRDPNGNLNCTIVPRPEGCQPFNFSLQEPSSQGYATAQRVVTEAINKYNSQGYILGADPGSPQYTGFQEVMKDLCCKYPNICKASLEKNCSSVNPDRLKYNTTQRQWCGCYLPDSYYKEYIDVYNINKECTPICNSAGNILLSNPSGAVKPCQQNVCLIDDVTIDIINSDVNQVNIGQFCGGCQSRTGSITQTSCTCIIDNSTVDIVNSRLNGQVNIGQQCTDPICTRRATPEEIKAGAPNIVRIPCDSPSDYNPFTTYIEEQEQLRQSRQSKSISIFLALIFLIIAIVIVYLFFRKRK